jgi:hypothetical protein
MRTFKEVGKAVPEAGTRENFDRRGFMPRIIVTTDRAERNLASVPADTAVLLDECVDSVHLCDDHAAEQLIERLAWAVTDAEDLQRASA